MLRPYVIMARLVVCKDDGFSTKVLQAIYY